MANGIEELQAEHERAKERHQAAVAQQEQATARLEELTGKIADSPVSAWGKLVREFVEAKGLAEVAETVGRILARREHAALLAIHQAELEELQGVAQVTSEARREAKARAEEFDVRLRRWRNHRDVDYEKLTGKAREEYRVALHRDQAEARARAVIADQHHNQASQKARIAREELERVKAEAPA